MGFRPEAARKNEVSSSMGKNDFAWRFILNENILFSFTISYPKVFVFFFSFYALLLNIYPKIKFTA